MLEGPYDANTQMMSDELRAQGYLSGVYDIDNAILNITGADAVVDVVTVELRDRLDASSVLASVDGILQSDGDLVDFDGISPLTFDCLPEEEYYISLKHRNHLGIRTLFTSFLDRNGVTLDFSDNSVATYGTNAQLDINGVLALYAGDADNDGQINAADRSQTWNERNSTGFYNADVDLDGNVNAADRSKTWNNRNLTEQLF